MLANDDFAVFQAQDQRLWITLYDRAILQAKHDMFNVLKAAPRRTVAYCHLNLKFPRRRLRKTVRDVMTSNLFDFLPVRLG